MGSVRCACVFLCLAFTVPLHAQPTRRTADEIPQLAPPLPEIPPTLWEQYGWLLGLAALFVLLLAAIITALLLRPGKPPRLPAAAAQARAVIAALQGRPEDGATLGQISQALRHYFIAAFWLHSGETTTAEFCAALKANAQVGPELSKAAGDFLRYCDERKFSPSHSTPPINAASRALELVEMAEAQRVKLHAAAPVPKPA